MTTLQTAYRKERLAREEQIYREWVSLCKNPESSKMAIYDYLMKKHKIHSHTTIWKMCKRVEKRLKKEEGK
jgi:hypothetical protein